MIPEISPDVRALIAHLAAVPVGGIVTLDDMAAVIGRDMADHRHLYYSAARILMRETGAVFASIRKVGYERLSAARAAEIIGPASRSRIRGTAMRGKRGLVATLASANDLAPDLVMKASNEIATLGLIAHLSSTAVAKAAPPPPTAPEPVAMTARRLLGITNGGTEA